MINSVSGVNFCGDAAPANAQSLINDPGKFSASAIAQTQPDSFEKAGEAPVEKKKSKVPVILGGILALAAATYVSLGIAVGKGKLTKAVANAGEEVGFMGKVKNFFVDIGENANKMWKKIRGQGGEETKKADAPETKADAPDGKPAETPAEETK